MVAAASSIVAELLGTRRQLDLRAVLERLKSPRPVLVPTVRETGATSDDEITNTVCATNTLHPSRPMPLPWEPFENSTWEDATNARTRDVYHSPRRIEGRRRLAHRRSSLRLPSITAESRGP
jgi:hypothetical protein